MLMDDEPASSPDLEWLEELNEWVFGYRDLNAWL